MFIKEVVKCIDAGVKLYVGVCVSLCNGAEVGCKT